jgi:hypothetical protein
VPHVDLQVVQQLITIAVSNVLQQSPPSGLFGPEIARQLIRLAMRDRRQDAFA